ncbi:MAG TPA: DnaJ domain-containing protein [Methylocella sp.]|jgi:hypothetical protein
MNIGLILSSTALGISLMVSAIKLADWLLHADPRAIIRMGRRLLFYLTITAVPSLVLLLIYKQWTFAMMLGAAMLIVPPALNWRALLPRAKFRPMWTKADLLDAIRGDFDPPPSSPELAHRAAIILEDYLAHAGFRGTASRIGDRDVPEGPPPASRRYAAMSAGEALEILGLAPGATAADISAAHRHLLQLVHPDRGGTNYLAAQINKAKEILLAKTGLSDRQQAAAKDEL